MAKTARSEQSIAKKFEPLIPGPETGVTTLAPSPLLEISKSRLITAADCRQYTDSLAPHEYINISQLQPRMFATAEFFPEGWERAQGRAARLNKTATLPEIIPPYLQVLIMVTGGARGPIGRQFLAQTDLENTEHPDRSADALAEDEFHPLDARGLPITQVTHKYTHHIGEYGVSWPGRALVTLTYNCGAYCRYCTRGREVGGDAGVADAFTRQRVYDWLDTQTPETMNEVILSGGDPLTLPPDVFREVVTKLAIMRHTGRLNVVRIGTRLPVHNPRALGPDNRNLQCIRELREKYPEFNPQIMLHINRPEELTTETVAVLRRLKTMGLNIYSQSVALSGVNFFVPEKTAPNRPSSLITATNWEEGVRLTLEFWRDFATKLLNVGMVPYYVFNNDRQEWNAHFDVPPEMLRQVFLLVRRHLTGLFTGRFIWDLAHGPDGQAGHKVPGIEDKNSLGLYPLWQLIWLWLKSRWVRGQTR